MSDDSRLIDDILTAVMDRIRLNRPVLRSTYRVQLNNKFTFRDATALVPYLARLGISHLYASPYLKASPGSTHGYDVIDHCRLNPELGTPEDYEKMVSALREHGMSHIADIVPNHVGIATNENVWWNDVLENGPASIYGEYFDINWAGSPLTDLTGRVLVPILAAAFGEELEKGNLRLSFDGGGFFVSYHQRRFPLSPRSFPMILSEDGPREIQSIITECKALPDRCQGASVASERHAKKNRIKQRLAELARQDKNIQRLIDGRIEQLNGVAGNASSFDQLDKLLRHQCFRLASWKTAPDEINYRRFFDVNDLAALSMERIEVFKATQSFILDLVARNKIAGLRVDHPDGLYDPEQYFRRLQVYHLLAVARVVFETSDRYRKVKWEQIEPPLLTRLDRDLSAIGGTEHGWPLYVVGEKILGTDESLPKCWAIEGASGYQFLNMTNGLFVDVSAAHQFTDIYHEWIQDRTPYADIAYSKKKLILTISLASELNMLAIRLKRIAQRSRHGIDFSLHALLAALKEMLACFPVYRSYITEKGVSETDRRDIRQAMDDAIRRNPKAETAVFRFIADTLLGDMSGDLTDEDRDSTRQFAGKFQQLSSPATAKGIEDTAFYVYNRLLSLNEVGGDPARFGVQPAELHRFFENRQRDWPHSMSTLSTHDTKRSEDVRARLNVLSEMPGQWREKLHRWSEMNALYRRTAQGCDAPDRNEEYALYQTLLGAWPFDSSEMDSFKKRVHDATLKSIREARIHSSWTDPNPEHESAVLSFLEKILDPSLSGDFLADFTAFQRKISRYGVLNSLSQSLIKLTAPGVPDTYQGVEIFDFSLMDPDNRRPVDFPRRREMVESITPKPNFPGMDDPDLAKMIVHGSALAARSQYPALFSQGRYVPIEPFGEKSRNLFAFARVWENQVAVITIPRFFSRLVEESEPWPFKPNVWGDTIIEPPEFTANRQFTNAFTGIQLQIGDDGKILAAELFRDWPVALFISE